VSAKRERSVPVGRPGPGGDPFVEIASWAAGDPFPWAGANVVAVDVIRSTTTAVTALETGRRCFSAATVDEATALAAGLHRPLLAGEVAGESVQGFHVGNSPAAIAVREDVERPLILLSSSGTALMSTAGHESRSAVVACMRNVAATAAHIVREGASVVLLGAETRGQFRDEDRLCCAWIAGRLLDAGYRPVGLTEEIVGAWRDRGPEAIAESPSARYLSGSGQRADLRFVLDHVEDVDRAFVLRDAEIVAAGGPATAAASAGWEAGAGPTHGR